MSTFIKIACDQCHKELEVDSVNESVFGSGWGKVPGHDEHYCDACWGDYCAENKVNPKTGLDISNTGKTCTMSCGKSATDTRTWEEIKSTCDDCRVN